MEKFYHISNCVIQTSHSDYQYNLSHWSNVSVFWFTLVSIVPKFIALWGRLRVSLVPKINPELILSLYYIEILTYKHVLVFHSDYQYRLAN